MKLMVLGRYGPFPAPGGACSSYLLEGPAEKGKTGFNDPTVRVVLDLGAGTLTRLLAVTSLENVEAIILSHLHSDHMSDMLVLRYALQQLHARGVRVPTPLNVIAPGEPEMEFRMLAAAGTFNMIKAEDGLKLRFGAMTITLHRMMHPAPSYAMDILEEQPKRYPVYGQDPPPKRILYTGDTGMHPGLPPLCKYASVLLADAGLTEKEGPRPYAHMTAREVGELARNAGVGRVLLTHLWGGGVDEQQLLHDAQAYFPAAEIAREMATYEV